MIALKQAEFSAQSYRFRYRVLSRVTLNKHKGSALRGTLFHSLRNVGCTRQEFTTCHKCPLVKSCAVSFLLATVDEESERGVDAPRPFTINAPLEDKNIYQPGEVLEFGLTLFAHSNDYLPHLLVALDRLDKVGLGAATQNARGDWERGRVRLEQVIACHPLGTQPEVLLYEISGSFRDVALNPLSESSVQAQLKALSSDSVCLARLNFETPVKLVSEGRFLHRPNFKVLIHRLIERYESYAGKFEPEQRSRLLELAESVRLIEDRTRWEDVRGYSHRQGQEVRLSGFVGTAIFAGRLAPLLPLLIWGQVLHVGKATTKGNGRYSLQYEVLPA